MQKKNKPRLAIFTHRLGAHSTTWLYRQAQGMRNFETLVCAEEHVNADIYPPSGFQVSTSPISRKDPPLKAKLNALLPLKRRMYPGHPKEKNWVIHQINAWQPDVILFQFGTVANRLAPTISRHFDIPMFAHFHGFDLSRMYKHSWYRKQIGEVACAISGSVVVGQYMRERLESLGAESDRIHLIPCGIPLADFAGGCSTNLQKFVMVGRLTEKKRPDISISAFRNATRDIADAELVIIGEGPMRKQCEQIAEGDPRIRFLGATSIETVRKHLSSASVFLQHSVTAHDGDMEGWPVAVAEAAASGLPVVSTRHASIPEQVLDQRTGYLVDEHDLPGMENAIRCLATDRQLRESMGKAARAHISQFDATTQIEKLESVLRSGFR